MIARTAAVRAWRDATAGSRPARALARAVIATAVAVLGSIHLGTLVEHGIRGTVFGTGGAAVLVYAMAAIAAPRGVAALTSGWKPGSGFILVAASSATVAVHVLLGGGTVALDAGRWIAVAAFQLVVVALPEELLFRGALQEAVSGVIGRALGGLGAIVVVAAVFTGAHVLASGEARALLVLLPALVLGWLKERTGSIWAPAVWHTLLNVLGVMAPVSG